MGEDADATRELPLDLQPEPRPPAHASPPTDLLETRDIDQDPHTSLHPELPEGEEEEQLGQGDFVGRYSVLSQLGRGGMGVVYKAYDPQLDRNVALKLLRRGRGSVKADLRLMREARTLAKLKHPNVVAVYDAGLTSHGVFIAMELVEGQTVNDWLEAGRRRVDEILDVFRDAGRGLLAAHQAGFVHRDFKPSNVIVGDDGVVRVLDFGLAHLVDDEGSGEALPSAAGDGDYETRRRTERPTGSTGSGVDTREVFSTEAGAIMGTPAFMAPEQILEGLGDHRSEQFSFAMSLYVVLYDRAPLGGETYQERRKNIAKGIKIVDRDLETSAFGERVPNRVRQVIVRGLATDPDARFVSMEEMLALLEPRKRRWGSVAAAFTLLLGFGVGAVVFDDDKEQPCLDPAAMLDGVWDSDDRDVVEGVFAAYGKGGDGAGERVTRALDEYSEAWVEMYAESCRATHVAHSQSEVLFDQRVRCLRRRQNRLRLAIDSLAGAQNSGDLVQRTVVPFKLPPIADCGDIEYVTAEQPPPENADDRERVAELRERIDEASTLSEAGDYPGAIAVVQQVVVDAEAVGYQPVVAEALERLGLWQVAGAGAADAEQTLERAIQVGAVARTDREAAAAWTTLLFSLMLQRRTDEGLILEPAVRAAVNRANDDVVRSWMLNNLGALHGERGDFDLATDYLRKAQTLKEKTLGKGHIEVGISWNNFGVLLTDQGELVEAEKAFGRARTIFEATVGGGHPMTHFAISGQCRVAQKQDQALQAVALCEEALARFEEQPPPPVWISRVSFNLAKAQWSLGRKDEALRSARRAREVILEDDPTRARIIARWIENPDAPPSRSKPEGAGEDTEGGDTGDDSTSSAESGTSTGAVASSDANGSTGTGTAEETSTTG